MLRARSASTDDRPIRKKLVVTLTARPASGTPRVDSDCFISTPGMLVIPPWGKSGGSVNMTSTVWLAGSALSSLRRNDKRAEIFCSGISMSAGMAGARGGPGLGAPPRGADIALAGGMFGFLLVEPVFLRDQAPLFGPWIRRGPAD